MWDEGEYDSADEAMLDEIRHYTQEIGPEGNEIVYQELMSMQVGDTKSYNNVPFRCKDITEEGTRVIEPILQ